MLDWEGDQDSAPDILVEIQTEDRGPYFDPDKTLPYMLRDSDETLPYMLGDDSYISLSLGDGMPSEPGSNQSEVETGMGSMVDAHSFDRNNTISLTPERPSLLQP